MNRKNGAKCYIWAWLLPCLLLLSPLELQFWLETVPEIRSPFSKDCLQILQETVPSPRTKINKAVKKYSFLATARLLKRSNFVCTSRVDFRICKEAMLSAVQIVYLKDSFSYQGVLFPCRQEVERVRYCHPLLRHSEMKQLAPKPIRRSP